MGQNNSNSMDMMSQLLAQVERLVVGIQQDRSTGGLLKTRVWCLVIGRLLCAIGVVTRQI